MGLLLLKTAIALASVRATHGCILKRTPPPCLCQGNGDAQRTILVMYSEWQGRSMELLTEQQSGNSLKMSPCKIPDPPPDGYLDGAVATKLGATILVCGGQHRDLHKTSVRTVSGFLDALYRISTQPP